MHRANPRQKKKKKKTTQLDRRKQKMNPESAGGKAKILLGEGREKASKELLLVK